MSTKGAFQIQDWIRKSEKIRKQILRFFSKQINPRSLGSWCVEETEKSTLGVNSSVSLTHHDPKDLGLICLEKNAKSVCGFKNPILDFLKETHPKRQKI